MQISYVNRTVTVSHLVAEDENFDQKLSEAQSLLSNFKSTGGSEWGCDGIGYLSAQKSGRISVKKSGVGPRNYEGTLKRMKFS